MDHSQISQIFFREIFTVPDQGTLRHLSSSAADIGTSASGIRDAMAPGQLVAVLESICAREVQSHLNEFEDVVVASSVQCLHRAPLPQGALVTVHGWVLALCAREATFWVLASDEQELVCEGTICFTMVRRSQIEMKMQRKREAIERRKLFTPARGVN
ncbi:MAG: thioesterase [Burkholderiaceae bacterium]|nr:thioesterase [Burkholderiaceae bacterium]